MTQDVVHSNLCRNKIFSILISEKLIFCLKFSVGSSPARSLASNKALRSVIYAITLSESLSNSGNFDSGHRCCGLRNHGGPFHQIEEFNSEGFFPLVAKSVGFSCIGTYLNTVPSSEISLNLLVTNTEGVCNT